MKYDWLLFDLDNTLLDFTKASDIAFREALLDFGFEDPGTYYASYKKINAKIWEAFENKEITAERLRSERFNRFFDKVGLTGDGGAFNALYITKIIENTFLLNGATSMLDDLKASAKLAIITNGLKEAQRPRIKEAALNSYFQTIIVSDEIGFAKPDPAFFEFTFANIGQPNKDRVLVIGDSLNSDIKGGNRYGLDTCWFNPSKKLNQSEIKPKFEISQLSEIQNLVYEGNSR